MNVSYVNPFVKATVLTFKTMLSSEAKPGEIFIKKDDHPTYDISGTIGLSGEAQGSIVLSFPKILALKIVSKLLGTPVKVIGDELMDGIGELANIIAGNAKQDLSDFSVSISLPNVVIGKNHFVVTRSDAPTIVVPFLMDIGAFDMEITIKTPG